MGLAISGDIVVWQDREGGRSSIYGYDLRTQIEFLIALGTNLAEPAVDGGFVVWQSHRSKGKGCNSADFDIYGARIPGDDSISQGLD